MIKNIQHTYLKENPWLITLYVLMFIVLPISINAQEPNGIDELLQKYRNNSESLTLKDFQSLTHYYYQKDSLILANKCINKGLILCEDEESLSTKANLLMQKGYIYLNWAGYDKSLEYFSLVHEIAHQLNDTNLLVGGYHGKGRVYSEIDDNNQAIIELTQGLKIAKLNQNERTIAIFNNALGIAHQGLENYSQAISHFEINEKISREIGDSLTEIYAIINRGSAYLLINQLEKGKACFDLAIVKNNSVNSSYATAAILGNLGNYSLLTQNYDSALYYSQRSIKISKENRFVSYLIESYNTLYETYIELDDFENALYNYRMQKELEDSVMNLEKISDINRLKIKHQAENQEAKDLILEAKLRNRTILSYGSILFAIFIIVILILLYSRFRLNKTIHKKEKDELNLTIDEKNRKLVSQLMETKMKHRILDEAGFLLDAIEKTKDQKELKSKIEEFKNTLQKSNKIEDDWQKINYHFEKVHQDFFKKLIDLHPTLSNNDLKLCAYTKMNLATKDIANLMNISYRSVQTNRYRIKKKMKLDGKLNFTSYIQSV